MTISSVAPAATPATAKPPAGAAAGAGGTRGLGALFAGLMGGLAPGLAGTGTPVGTAGGSADGTTDGATDSPTDGPAEELTVALGASADGLTDGLTEGLTGRLTGGLTGHGEPGTDTDLPAEPALDVTALPAGPVLAPLPVVITQPPALTQATTAAARSEGPAAMAAGPAPAPDTAPDAATVPDAMQATAQATGTTEAAAATELAEPPRTAESGGAGASQPPHADAQSGMHSGREHGHGEDRPAQQTVRGEPSAAAQPGGSVTGAVTATGASTRSDGPSGPSAAAITGQVFGEVSRLVSREDGTRRITLKLQPEALGEVRVVLTVRNGEVHVRMAGSELAQRALQQGSSELHRLLEHAGAGSSQIVVGEQSSSAQHDRSGAQHWGDQDSLGSFEGRRTAQDHTDNRNAGTRDGAAPARDGSTRGTHPRLSTDPVALTGGSTRTRVAGVDVTI